MDSELFFVDVEFEVVVLLVVANSDFFPANTRINAAFFDQDVSFIIYKTANNVKSYMKYAILKKSPIKKAVYTRL